MDAKKNQYNIKKLENNLRNNNIFIDNLPTQVHFLMIDKCNAKCIMCGGNYFHSKSQRKITLDKFKKMASNLQLQLCSGIVLAGAGDPLLNRDLVPIIQFVREKYPHIRISVTTNGIALTKKLSKSFIDNDVGVVNVSINSATREGYERIMQVDCFDKVCENTKNLVDLKNRLGRMTRVQFSCAINRLNIKELPLLVELSRDLGVESINVMYCRFYPEKIRHLNVTHEENYLHDRDSLFYYQELSDIVVEKTEVLAKKYCIDFSHEPLFKEDTPVQPCIWPVMELMVGFDGEVYPCGGSEVHFKEKVEKGVYNFGNALTEPIDSFWNNEYYLALRISSKKGEAYLTSECRCCANALSHKEIGAHIMEWDKSIFGEKKQSAYVQKETEIKCPEDISPLVSIILPTYNRPEMLAEALESILKQTFRNFEIVVVNDAGMRVEDVVLKFNKEKNITYVSHAKNRGLAAARNTGIMVARGKYIALLDDDDLFYPDHLETAMIHVCEKTPVIYTDAARATYEKYKDSYRLIGKKVPYSIDFKRDKLLVGNIAPVNCFVFEREKALQAGLFDETLTTLEDWDFWIRLSEGCTFKHIAKVTAQVNWRTDGTTMTSSLGAEFGKNREKIYKRYQEQISKIDDIESILEEFEKIWGEDDNPVQPLVSIIILVCNQIAYTRKCMESIIKHTKVPFELIVVDNASTDGTLQYLESELTQLIPEDRLRIIKNNENIGFAKGNNQGIAASRAAYVMLLNNDVVVTPGWLSKMMVCAEKIPMTGIVGPKSNCVSGPQLVEDVSYDTNNLGGLEIFASEFAENNSGKATPFNRLVGFCMLIKRAVIDKIGGLDGRYGLGNFEDNDFCLRALLAGYELYIAEDCFVHHFGNRTFIGEHIDYRESLHQNWEIFKKKWEIPKDLPYGSYYDYTNLAKDGFIYSKHYSSFEEKPDLQVAKEKTTPQALSIPVEDKYHEIIQLSARGKKKEARGALEQLLLANPDFALAHNDLGVLYFQDGDTARALKHYERAVALQPVNINFVKNLADFYFVELGRVEDALKLYNKALYINPKDIETLLIIGHICVSLKKFDDAKVFYNKVLQIDPLNADARQMLDKLLNHEQRINQDVQEKGSKVTSKTRKYFNTKWNEADAHGLSGKRFLTLKAIERGKEVYEKGHSENAVEILLEGIRLSPDDKQPYYALAEILLNAKKYKDAIDVLNEMPLDDRDDQDAGKLALMGYCKEGMGLDKEALYNADCALSINGDLAAAYNLKGILAFKQGDIGSAKDYFNRAIESDHGYGEPYTNLGAILWGKNPDKAPDKALDLLEKGFILSPASPDIVANYHSAVLKLGEFERAEPVFQDAGLLYPNNKNIKYKLIDILIKQQKHKEAMHQIEEAMALYGTDDGILSAALKIRDLLGPKEIGKSKDKKNTVSLCMIVKNEQEHLAKCLRSVKPVVDEMIVVDTGSTDRTKELARVFGAKVYDHEWTDNFAEARNFSISKASGTLTFHLDADEVISAVDYGVFRKITRLPASKQVAFLFTTRNYTMDANKVGWTPNDGKYEKEESGTGWTLSDKVRLFRRDRCIRFEYPVHELVEPSLKKAGVALKKCTIPIHHYGILNKGKSADKSEVYYRIGRKKLDEMGDDTVALREMAIQAEILGKHDEAVELWERFIAIEPNVPEAFINMGIAYCSLGKFEDVLETAKKALNLAPDMKEAHYNYALGKLNTGDSDEAVLVLEKLLERFDEYLPARFILAAAYCCKGEKGKGIKILEHLKKTSIGTGLPIRCHDLARGLVSSHRYSFALGILDAAIESKNSNKDVLELYSQCLKITDDNEKRGTSGITFCENIKSTVPKSDPGNKVIAMNMVKQAKELNQKGQTDNAIEAALKAIGYFPDDKGAYYALAEILINAKKYQDAIEVLNEMTSDEQDAKRLELTGYCKEGMKLYDEAQNYANQALSLNQASAPALNLKGVLAYNRGDNSEAENFFIKAMEADTGYGEPYTNLGAILWDNTPEDALDLFEKGFIHSPTVTDVVMNYHIAASTLGKFERAEGIFQDAGSLYPNNKMIKYQLIDMLIKQEKNAEAMNRIEEAIALFGVDDGILSAALKIRDLLGPKEIDKTKHKKNTVSLCMIVKNEEKHLARCLNSVKSIVDEMIVVDTGSTDMTKDIAKVFGAKAYDFEWNDDFSEARNFSISKASGKWSLIMDADEAISSLDYSKFKKIIKKTKPVAYQFTTRNYTLLFNMIGWNANDEKYINENAGVGWSPSDKVRLFPNKNGVRFEYPIHELIEPSLKKTGLEVKKCKIPIHHYGRLDQGESDKKGEIYYQIGQKKLNEMKDNANALLELAIQAGILGKYEESIELWERYINIKPGTPMAFVNMGAMYTKLGKYGKAVSAAEKALEIEPDMKEAHYNCAFSKVHLGHVKEAILVLEKLFSRFTEYPPAQFLLAVAYCLEAREAKWRKDFEKLRLTMGSGLAVACHEFAKGLVSAKRPDYAVTLLEAAIESKNNNKEINELYSKCLEMINVDRKTGTMGNL